VATVYDASVRKRHLFFQKVAAAAGKATGRGGVALIDPQMARRQLELLCAGNATCAANLVYRGTSPVSAAAKILPDAKTNEPLGLS